MAYVKNKKTGKLEYQNPNKPIDTKRYEAISGSTNLTYTTPTGEKLQGVIDKTKGAYVNPQSDIQAEASRRIAATNREAQIQDIVKANAPPQTQAELDLAKKQQQEIAAIDALKSNIPPMSVSNRNAAAGLATINSLMSNLGINKNIDPNAEIQNLNKEPFGFLAKGILGGIGLVSGTSIKGISLSSLFSSEQQSIDNLNGDIAKNVAEAKRISTAATSKGANVQEAIGSLLKLEESVRYKYGAAQSALNNDPRDIKAGLDIADDMSYSLRAITEQRQALERYALTGNPKEVLGLVGYDTTGVLE